MTYTFDPDQATRSREEAIRRVDEHAMETWKLMAATAIQTVATLRDYFTTDAVWAVLEKLTDIEPHEPRAMGAAMRRAAREGLCVKTNMTRESIRTSCNRRPLAVWESRIVKSPQQAGARLGAEMGTSGVAK